MFRANCLFLGQIVTFRANCLRPPSKMPSRTLMGKVLFHSLIVGTFQVDFARSWQKKTNLIHTKLMQILRMLLLERPHKKLSH